MRGKKSLEYQLQYALRVVQNDPNARILYVCRDYDRARHVWATLMNLVGKPEGFSYYIQTLEAKHENGGILTVRAPHPTYNGGEIGSHMWFDETLDRRMRTLMQSKIRSSRPIGPEPMGAYDEWGVTRRTDY